MCIDLSERDYFDISKIMSDAVDNEQYLSSSSDCKAEVLQILDHSTRLSVVMERVNAARQDVIGFD